jgi:hypothetical protein
MSDEIKVEVPSPGTEDQIRKAIEAKLDLISTELRRTGRQQVVVLEVPVHKVKP